MRGHQGLPVLGQGRRVLFLAAGGYHDDGYLAALNEAGFSVLYVHLLDGMERYCPAGIPAVHLGYRAIHGSGLSESVARVVRKIPPALRVFSIARQFRPDIIYADWVPTTGFWAALTGVRPLFINSWGSDLRTRARESWWIHQVARFTLRRADAIVCDNHHTREVVLEDYALPADRIHVLGLGVERDLFRPSPELREKTRAKIRWSDAKIVVHARPLEPLYDPFTFLAAFRVLAAGLPEARAVVAGEGSLKGPLLSRVAEWGLSNRVLFTGLVPREELAGYLSAADLLISCPLDDGSSRSVLEAMACGLPVVASDLPAMREWFEDGQGGVLCPTRDAAAFSRAMDELLRDDLRRQRAGARNGRVARERADRATNRRKFVQILADVLDRGEPARGNAAVQWGNSGAWK